MESFHGDQMMNEAAVSMRQHFTVADPTIVRQFCVHFEYARIAFRVECTVAPRVLIRRM
jgi:hypothetical protein